MIGVEKIQDSAHVDDDSDEYGPWSTVSEIDLWSTKGVDGSFDIDDEQMNRFQSTLIKSYKMTFLEVNTNRWGVQMVKMRLWKMAEISHLQKELKESEYEVAKLQLDNGLLVNGKSDNCASTHSS